MSPKLIYLVRHCQAEHNVNRDYSLHDPVLTKLGMQEAAKLGNDTRGAIQSSVDLLVTSPLRRAIQTTLIAFDPIVQRVGREHVILLPQAQERNKYPCDTGSPKDKLEADERFSGLDCSLLAKNPGWTVPTGEYAPDVASLRARAKYVRRWLREREEQTIILVSHGNFIRYIMNKGRAEEGYLFSNAEIRSFVFQAEDDDDAWLVENEYIGSTGAQVKPASET